MGGVVVARAPSHAVVATSLATFLAPCLRSAMTATALFSACATSPRPSPISSTAAAAGDASPRDKDGDEDARTTGVGTSHEKVESGTSSFGFQRVPREAKAGLVGGVFSRVSGYYDLMNDLMSAGMHRMWKNTLVSRLRPFPGMQHLDVAGGTGDIGLRVLRAIRAAEAERGGGGAGTIVGRVTVSDINEDMLEAGKRDMHAKWRRFGRSARGALGSQSKDLSIGEDGIRWVAADAECLPFDDCSFDSYTIAFGIRNCTNPSAVLDEARRVLKPGGVFMCLEFSRMNNPIAAQAYDYYSFNVIPMIGQVAVGDADSYRYLVESIKQFPDQDTFKDMVEDSGLKMASYENILDGVVAIHYGVKVEDAAPPSSSSVSASTTSPAEVGGLEAADPSVS